MKKIFHLFCFCIICFLQSQGQITLEEPENPVIVESIPLNNQQDVEDVRKKIWNYIWGEEKKPEIIVDAKVDEDDVAISEYLYAPSLKNVETITVDLKNGFTSKIYLFHPKINNGLKIPVLYHAGHGFGLFLEDRYLNNSGDIYSASVIDYLLSKGFDVIGINMPLYGKNTYPSEVVSEGKTVYINTHDDLFKLKNPFYYFIAPVNAVLDFLEKQKGYQQFVMIGLSGGGWTTTLYSAIDTRIQQSYPVAATLPIPLRKQVNDMGDAEQSYAPFYDQFNYSTLYFLGSAGEGRMQYQILNKKDDCCYTLDGKNYWVDYVKSQMNKAEVKGEYNFYYDTYALKHKISSVALDSIYANIINKLANKKMKELFTISSSTPNNILCNTNNLYLNIPYEEANQIEWFRNKFPIKAQTDSLLEVNRQGWYYARISNISGASILTERAFIKRTKLRKPEINNRNDSLVSSYQTGNQWYLNGHPIPGATQQSIMPLTPGQYTVSVSRDECMSEISEPYNYGLVIYPNPAIKELNILLNGNLGVISYRISTSNGVLVKKGQFFGATTIYFPSSFPSGVYILELNNSKGFKVNKLILVKSY